MAKPSKPAVLAPVAPLKFTAACGIVAECDLAQSHCCMVPASDAAPDRSGVLGEFEHAGVRYRVLARRPRNERLDGGTGAIDPAGFLTMREMQIVRLICFGCVNKQIALRLRISEYTVKTYLKQIFMKLHVHSRSAVVFRCAAWAGGIPLPGADTSRGR